MGVPPLSSLKLALYNASIPTSHYLKMGQRVGARRSPSSPDRLRLAPLALDRTRLARIIPVPAFSGEKVLSNDYLDQSDQLSGDLPTLTVLP